MWVRDSFEISNTLIPSPHVYKCNFTILIYICKHFNSKNFLTLDTHHESQRIKKRISYLTL